MGLLCLRVTGCLQVVETDEASQGKGENVLFIYCGLTALRDRQMESITTLRHMGRMNIIKSWWRYQDLSSGQVERVTTIGWTGSCIRHAARDLSSTL